MPAPTTSDEPLRTPRTVVPRMQHNLELEHNGKKVQTTVDFPVAVNINVLCKKTSETAQHPLGLCCQCAEKYTHISSETVQDHNMQSDLLQYKHYKQLH